MESKVGPLAALLVRVQGGDCFRCLTSQDIIAAIPCTIPPHPATALLFARIACNVAWNGYASACEVLREAGAVPVIVEALRRWPATGSDEDTEVHARACETICRLAEFGLGPVHAALRSVPDLQPLLADLAVPGKASRAKTQDYAIRALTCISDLSREDKVRCRLLCLILIDS